MSTKIPDDGPLPWYAAPMTPARRQALDRLSAASQYAWIQLADPAMRAEYESRTRTKKSAYALAVADFLNPPEIRAVNLQQYTGCAGEVITLHVTDDFKVAGVRLELLDSNGAVIEAGEASEQTQTRWRYKTKQTAPPFTRLTLAITAYDTPGNTDKQAIQLVAGAASGIVRCSTRTAVCPLNQPCCNQTLNFKP